MERVEELRMEIESLLAAKPETGAQWAHICALENEMVALKSKRNSQVAEPLRQILTIFTPLVR